MKFVAPEVEIKKFDVVDVLTTSGGETPIPTMESAAVFGLKDCGPNADT